MLPGLQEGQEKMSKSDPASAIFMEDEEVRAYAEVLLLFTWNFFYSMIKQVIYVFLISPIYFFGEGYSVLVLYIVCGHFMDHLSFHIFSSQSIC